MLGKRKDITRIGTALHLFSTSLFHLPKKLQTDITEIFHMSVHGLLFHLRWQTLFDCSTLYYNLDFFGIP